MPAVPSCAGTSAAALVPCILQRWRLYVVPHLHPFTSSIRPSTAQQASVVTLHCRFSSKARLSYLLDHVVMGRPLLPAAAMLELAAAAAASLTHDSAHDSGDLLSISNMSISAPIILPSAAGDSAWFKLVCSLDIATGQLSIGCVQAAGFKPMTCATATASLVKGAPTASASAQQSSQIQASAAAVRSVLGDVVRQGIAAASTGSATAPAAAANPVGTIAPVADGWAASGYFSAPQQVDSALHLGIVAPGSGAKVPVAVSAFLLPVAAARTAGTGPLHASTCSASSSSSTTASAAGLSTSSFLLSDAACEAAASAAGRVAGQASALGASTGGLVALVEDLQTKVVNRADLLKARTQHQAAGSPAAAGADSKQGSKAAEDVEEVYPCSYETTWQVKEAAAAAREAQLDSRHAGKLSLVVHDTIEPSRHTASEHLVLQLQPQASNGCTSAAAAAASTLAVLQQINAVQQAHAAAGSGQQLSIHAGLSFAGSALGPDDGLQGLTGATTAADASSAVHGLLRTEATEQTAMVVSLQAMDSLSAPQRSPSASASPGALAATAVTSGARGVPRMLPCAKPGGAEFFKIRPEPRSALSNLVARAADIGQVGGCCCWTLKCVFLCARCSQLHPFVFVLGRHRQLTGAAILSCKRLRFTRDCTC